MLSSSRLGVYRKCFCKPFCERSSCFGTWYNRLLHVSTEHNGKFYSYALKVAANYNKYDNEDGLEVAIDSVLQMDDFDYLELDNAYGDMSFFFHDKRTRKYIYNAIYSKTLDIRNLIKEKSYHFKIYRKSVNGNKAVMQKFIDEIDAAIMARSTHVCRNEDGTEMTVASCENKLVLDLHKEIGGKYYDLMYPFKKEASDNADQIHSFHP